MNRTPFTGGIHGTPIFRPGTTEFKLNHAVLAPYVYQISPGYFEAAGTRLLDGRDVSWHDTAKTPHVAIVNRTFARKMWAKCPAIGQRFLVNASLTEVVGVVEDGKYHDLEEPPQPAAFLPSSQSEPGETVFVVRSPRASNEMTPALQRALRAIDPEASITLQDWSDAVAGELFPSRAATVALGAIGLLAAMLAVTGIFGMAAYSVSRRKKELGIRVALGARRAQVMSAAVGRPIVLLGVGAAVGLLAGVLAARLLGQIVYQANPRDPIVLGGAVLTMALTGRRGICDSGLARYGGRSVQTHERRMRLAARFCRRKCEAAAHAPQQSLRHTASWSTSGLRAGCLNRRGNGLLYRLLTLSIPRTWNPNTTV
ncbi:MAG: FtsX-like permease family protein [Ignavibacteriota bacterium]